MKKLILGIIAVTLLQIAFLLRTATSTWTVVPPVVSIPVSPRQPSSPPAQVNESPEVAVVPEKHLRTDEKKTSAVPSTTRVRREPVDRRKAPSSIELAHVFRPVVISVPAHTGKTLQTAEARISPITTRIPSGSTMALTDYPSTTQMAAVAKPRRRIEKRSLVARVFSPLVKKPWNFLKSVASKLN